MSTRQEAGLSEYRAISLFSGCGGFSEGAKLAGFDVQAAVEHDRFAVETYRHNFPDVPLFADDIGAFLCPGDARWEAERERFAGIDGGVDLVFGGPPCQGYSQIGTRRLKDHRNNLYEQFVRVLTAMRPRAFLMENVPNMLMLRKGLFANRALAAFAEAGYSNVAVKVLHANDFGVAQVRKRAVFFGVRDGVPFPYEAGAWIEGVADAERRLETTVWQAIGDLPEAVSDPNETLPYPPGGRGNPIRHELRLDRDGEFYSAGYKRARAGGRLLHNHHTKEIQDRRKKLIAQLKPGFKGDSLPREVWNGLRPEKWRRLHPDKPAYTILAQMHRDLSEWVHPRYERWITVREAARLQSFHDGFVFKSSEWQMLKQVGNAVPPLLGRAVAMIGRRALETLDGVYEPPAELEERLGAAKLAA